MGIKLTGNLRSITKKARKEVGKWPKWKRAIRVTKYSTGFLKEGE